MNTITPDECGHRCNIIASAINSYEGKGVSSVKKEFQERISKIQRSIHKEATIQKKTTNHNATYLSVIDLLEQAHSSISESDFPRGSNLIKTAECLMPDSTDEISNVLWSQIQALKNQLSQ